MQTDIDTQQGSSVCARLGIVGWIVLTMAVALLAVTVTMRSIMTAQPFTSMHSLMERYLARQQPMAGEDFVAKAEGKVATTGTTADHAGRQLAQDPVFVGRILASEKTSGVSNSEHGTVRWAKAVAQDAGRPTAPMILFLGTAKRQRAGRRQPRTCRQGQSANPAIAVNHCPALAGLLVSRGRNAGQPARRQWRTSRNTRDQRCSHGCALSGGSC